MTKQELMFRRAELMINPPICNLEPKLYDELLAKADKAKSKSWRTRFSKMASKLIVQVK